MGKTTPVIEVGVGVEYGGLGTQLHFPMLSKSVELFIATGVYKLSTRDGESIAYGTGANYFMDENQAYSLYYGLIKEERYLGETLELKSDKEFGLSLGYKYFVSSRNESGLSFGGTLNVYEGGAYPFISVGYRF